METLLITKADFLPYRAITANVDDTKRLDPHIVEAQRIDLFNLIGSHLYYDLIANVTAYNNAYAAYLAAYIPTLENPTPTTIYKASFVASDPQQMFYDLLNGASYDATVNNTEIVKTFPGLKAVLVYYTYKRFVNRDNIRSTPTGFVIKNTAESTPISSKQIAEEANRAEADARMFFEFCEEFMRDNSTFFRTYNYGCGQTNGHSNATRLTAPRNKNTQSSGWNRIETGRGYSGRRRF